MFITKHNIPGSMTSYIIQLATCKVSYIKLVQFSYELTQRLN